MNLLPERLSEIIEEFQWSEGREKLELLLYYAEKLPPLPERLEDLGDNFQQIKECMTPVFVYAEVEDGKMRYYFKIPPESPTVRGYASLLTEGLEGTTAEEVLQIPNDFYLEMGLHKVLTNQRLIGIDAILAHMKRLALDTIKD
jgi:cysteine desulfuration protein SufE